MNRSEISNDFNFQNELDISNTRKDRTENFFSKEGFQIEDFMNIGDHTSKSDKFQSKLQHNTSKILKDQNQEQIPSKILDQFSYYSRGKKNQRDELLVSNTSQHSNLSKSPKFVEAAPTTKSIGLSPPLSPRKQEFTLRRPDGKAIQSKALIQQVNIDNAFKKKNNEGTLLQNEYQCLQSQIRFYKEQSQKMLYASSQMQEQTQNLMLSFSSEAHERQLEQHAAEIKSINKQIEHQRQLEAQLTKMVRQVEEEYQSVVNSIKTAKFPRPAMVKDQAKAIIDEINALKAEFQAMERDDGSLNLSSTLVVPISSGPTKNPSSLVSPQKQQQQIAQSRISQIFQYNKQAEDPRYLINLKMACLKSQWSLFTNSEIQVSVSYRDSPKITVRIGNKLSKDLQKFSLFQNGSSKLQGQIIAAKSYYTHLIVINPTIVNELFAKIEITYQIMTDKKSVTLFIPLGMTTFGEFSPITKKQFQNDANDSPFAACGSYRPIDKKLMSDLSELTVYLPNLILNEQTQTCFGLFIFPFQDGDLVIFRQRGEMLSISTKNESWPLIRMLEFIFTV